MKIGPFSVNDFNGVKELLERRKIEHTVEVDQEAERAILAKFNDQAQGNPRAMAGSLNLQIVYFEIADADFPKIQDVMEKYGVLPLSDGSYELGEDE